MESLSSMTCLFRCDFEFFSVRNDFCTLLIVALIAFVDYARMVKLFLPQVTQLLQSSMELDLLKLESRDSRKLSEAALHDLFTIHG